MSRNYSDEELHALRVSNCTEWKKDPEKVAAAQAKSRETRRRNKEMQREAQYILNAELLDDNEIAAELKALGYSDDGENGRPTYQTAMLFGLMKKAVYHQDVEAAKFIRDTSGQKPVEGMQIGTLDDKPLEIDLKSYTDEQLLEMIARAREEDGDE